MKKSLIIGTPLAVLAVVVIALIAVWAWGGGPLGGEHARVKANVEYTIQDANGVVKAHGLVHNAVVDALRVDAATALSTGAGAVTYGVIGLCGSGTSAGTTTATACATLTGGLSTNNPISDTVAQVAVVAGTSKSFTVTQTFNATGAATITEIQLAKGTATTGTASTAGNIGAYRALAATLANGDSITITWTVTIS